MACCRRSKVEISVKSGHDMSPIYDPKGPRTQIIGPFKGFQGGYIGFRVQGPRTQIIGF